MKKTMKFFSLIFLIAGLAMVGCQPAEEGGGGNGAGGTESSGGSETKEEGSENKEGAHSKPAEEAETSLVSLKLPNMTWGGCAAAVRGALTQHEGVSDIETDIASTTLKFKCSEGFDVEATMNAVAEVTDKAKDWELIEN